MLAVLMGCTTSKIVPKDYQSDTLSIRQLTPNVFLHVSYLDIPYYGKFPCNGLIYRNKKRVIIFDTPINDTVSQELVQWVEQSLNGKIKAVVINHFHNDCLGGLDVFHDLGIPSYASEKTIALAKERGEEVVPKNGFADQLELTIGKAVVQNVFIGEGHTKDNIVSYLPQEKVLFGGCLIKAVGAGRGNLADATLSEWSNTVRKVKEAFPEVKIVVPGHAKVGGRELLDFTIELFE